MILRIGLKMFRKFGDPCRKDSYLNFRRTGIAFLQCIQVSPVRGFLYFSLPFLILPLEDEFQILIAIGLDLRVDFGSTMIINDFVPQLRIEFPFGDIAQDFCLASFIRGDGAGNPQVTAVPTLVFCDSYGCAILPLQSNKFS